MIMKQHLKLNITHMWTQFTWVSLRFLKKVKKIHYKLDKIRSRAENWSADVFFSALTDFPEKIIFSIILKKIRPKNYILSKISEIFEKLHFFGPHFFEKFEKILLSWQSWITMKNTSTDQVLALERNFYVIMMWIFK